jgi:hypothetical protein
LRLRVPTSATIASTTISLIRASDNGGPQVTGMAIAGSGNAYVQLFPVVAGTGWATATDTTEVWGQIFFEIS